MQTERTREHAVSEADLRHIVRRRAAHRRDTRDAFRPHIEVILRIAYDGGLTRRTRRGVHAHELFSRNGKEAERIIVAKIRLRGERQLREIFQCLDVVGFHAGFVHLLAIRKHFFIHAMHRLLQTFELNGFYLASR